MGSSSASLHQKYDDNDCNVLLSTTQGNISCATAVYKQLMHMEEWREATCLAWQMQWMSLLYSMLNKELKLQGSVQCTGFARTYLCVCCDMYMHVGVNEVLESYI